MDRRNLIIVAVAVVLGLVAVYVANTWFSGMEQRQEQLAEEQDLVQVVVASRDLEFGGPITNESVRLANWPRESLPAGAITDIDRILNERNVAIRPIVMGEPVLISRISDRAILSSNIPENMRAVTVPVNAVTGVAGFVFPSDVVDVFLTRQIPGDGASADDQMTTVLLQNIQVLAVDRRSGEDSTEPAVSDTATLLVSPFDAQKLTLATQVGRLSLALRNVEDQLAEGGSRVATPRDLGGNGLYIGGRREQPSAPAAAPVTSGGGSAAPARRSGPSMVVYRGTEASRQEVVSDASY